MKKIKQRRGLVALMVAAAALLYLGGYQRWQTYESITILTPQTIGLKNSAMLSNQSGVMGGIT
jgi:hypothetical protein